MQVRGLSTLTLKFQHEMVCLYFCILMLTVSRSVVKFAEPAVFRPLAPPLLHGHVLSLVTSFTGRLYGNADVEGQHTLNYPLFGAACAVADLLTCFCSPSIDPADGMCCSIYGGYWLCYVSLRHWSRLLHLQDVPVSSLRQCFPT